MPLQTAPLSRRFSVAPMMDWTDRHCRFFLRLLSKHALLYTEMVTTGAILHGDHDRFLRHNETEHPLALQLGGSVPADLAACARMAEAAGYDEVNLNVGCPSDRVQNNMIGAILMAHPALVADCVKAMRDAVSISVTVKHRIGINGRDSYAELCDFVGTVKDAGCTSFTVHARIAILEGLSPKENRDIPPLRYDVAAQLKQDFPELEINLNGGIKTLEQCQEHLQTFDGVMLGREAYHNPYLLAEVDQCITLRAMFWGWGPVSRGRVSFGSCCRWIFIRRVIRWRCWIRLGNCWKGVDWIAAGGRLFVGASLLARNP